MAILQQMVVNAGTYPACGLSGMNTVGVGTLFNHARQPGGGPSGQDCVRFTHLANGNVHSQYTYGWTINTLEPGGTDPALGSTRYHRYYVKFIGTQNYAGNSGPWYTKFIIQGADNPGIDEGRIISWLGVGHINDTDNIVEASKNISGTGTTASISPPLANNTWHSVQVGITAATTLLGTNAIIKLWINTDVLGTPTDSESGLNITTNGWGGQSTAIAGGFAQTTINSSGLAVHDVCEYQYSDVFDSSWFANMGTGGSPAPTVSSASPNSGTTAGVTSITITGTGFVATPTVTVGGVACTSVHFTSATQIECVTGAHSAGAVDVVVTNPDTQTGTGTNAYTYTAPGSLGNIPRSLLAVI